MLASEFDFPSEWVGFNVPPDTIPPNIAIESNFLKQYWKKITARMGLKDCFSNKFSNCCNYHVKQFCPSGFSSLAVKQSYILTRGPQKLEKKSSLGSVNITKYIAVINVWQKVLPQIPNWRGGGLVPLP